MLGSPFSFPSHVALVLRGQVLSYAARTVLGMTSSSAMTLGAYNFEAADPGELGHFWSQLTGGATSAAGESVYIAPAGEHGFGVFLQPLRGTRPDRQISHLDLTVPWGTRASEVERAEALGATVEWHVLDEHPHVRWTTLSDPEGNLFCLAEHPPTT